MLTAIHEQCERNRVDAHKWADEACKSNQEKAEATFLFVQEAGSQGIFFKLPEATWQATEPIYTVHQDDKWVQTWRVIRNCVGTLEQAGMEPADHDARKRLVWVYLRPQDKRFHHIRFKMMKKLPKTQAKKCRMVRVKPESYLTIVCEK